MHTRASKVEETLKELLRKHNARAVDSFSLGKRTQYGMIKMGSKEEAACFAQDLQAAWSVYPAARKWLEGLKPKKR